MEYTLVTNDGAYSLPKLTLNIREKIETVNKKIANTNVPVSDRIKVQHEFIVDVLGADSAKEILETDNINEMDINDLSILYLNICKAYDKPFNDAKKPQINPADRELVLEFLKNLDNVKHMGAKNFMGYGA